MECLSEVRKIEKCISNIIDFVDTWKNLSKQLEATKKMPQYTSLMLHSSSWQSRLVVQIELEIDIIAGKLSEQWEQIKENVSVLSDFVSADCHSQRTTSLSYLRDLQHLLSYLTLEVVRWLEMHDCVSYPTAFVPVKPNFKLEKTIERCKQSLQAIASNTSEKSS